MVNQDTDLSHCIRCGYLLIKGERSEHVEPGHRRVTNRDIERMYNALIGISTFALASDKSERKVAIMLRKYLDIPYQVFEQQKKLMFIRVSSPGAIEISPRISEMRNIELLDLMNDTQDIPEIPSNLFLDDNDFPKVPKGDPRPAMLSNLQFRLGFLFTMSDTLE